ncbi:hypothetical protein [Streptosporangium roseum]|uniref:MFS transporter n=1 Tax=Streptosporangium roseum (strain ATCC 12428 / DSM 43021 / JCM 3005 / KCTC 9067 / NCIMB 10171 / NRRL 2505 / NI 9100) TaxID=479432 RepID=D2BCE2_STRRD|nr:hypothetical protein [Streptosporangium roseum]ACZ89971.1 hypothetical protein Sros_7284 [Streptosporangium roseum DSM 43021]
MAVPPTQPTRAVTAGPKGVARPLGVSAVLDVILGLLVAVVLPLAIVAIPNTISVVATLLPPEISQIAMVRAHGLALPAMVLTVPPAAIAVRRMRAAPLLVAGLTLLAVADAAGGYADSTLLVGVLRVLHGIGAGLLVPATLAAVWERSPLLRALWGGMLAVSLLTAQALALWPLDEVRSWRVTLQPYPMLTGVALALAAVYLVLWMKRGQGAPAGGGTDVAEGGRLPVAMVPAVAIAALALGSTFDWPPDLLIGAALLSILVLFGLASLRILGGAGGQVPAYTMLAVGVVVLPTAAQVTYVELGGLGGPGLSGLWPAFVIAGVAGVAAAALVSRLGDGAVSLAGAGGLVLVVAGLCAVRLLLPAPGGPAPIVPLTLLGVGAAVALTSALRSSGPGAALFALSLFFPAVLSGFLLGSGVQFMSLKDAATSQALVDGFVDALHLWALIGGGLVVAVIVLCSVLARRSPVPASATADTAAGDSLPPGGRAPAEGLPAGRPSADQPAGGLGGSRVQPPSATAAAASAPPPASPAPPSASPAPPSASPAPAAPPSASPTPVDPPSAAPAPEAVKRSRRSAGRATGPVMVPEPAPELEPLAGPQPPWPAPAARAEPEAGGEGDRPGRDGSEPGAEPRPDPRSEPRPDKTGTLPVVPPPTPSPEDALGDGPART